jgi:hypothetical protein
LIEEDFIRVIEEVKNFDKMHGIYNTTFIALILKKDNHESFEEFRPISLCNCIYKIIAKVLEVRIKGVFLASRKIHYTIAWTHI